MTPGKLIGLLRLFALVALTLLLGAFHGFVGWHKAFSTREELVQHAAWTIHLPLWLGKLVGWTEMIVTAALLCAVFRRSWSRVGFWSCVIFIALELMATFTHYRTQDGGSLVQNAVTISLTAVLAWLHSTRFRKTS
jgi:DoxX-like family